VQLCLRLYIKKHMSLLQRGTEVEWSILERKKIVKEVVFLWPWILILMFGYKTQNGVCEWWYVTRN